MSETTTVRLNDEERALLDELAAVYGGRSGAIKHGLQMLAQDRNRRLALADFMDAWSAESGPPDPEGVAAMRKRFFSDR
ncbi:hypothetical protein [Candidatus Poriferisodalis sp.]|uniref:hypothetical protein n=1 Tax=Candidatus Poriferisodalis sp. TaxID=3101277 RepID=UPI003B015A04